MTSTSDPTAETLVLARAALRHLESAKPPEAVAALEEAWRSGREQEWLLEFRELVLLASGAASLAEVASGLRARLPAELPGIAAIVAKGGSARSDATRSALAANSAKVESIEADLLPSGEPDWNRAVERASSPFVLLLEAGDRPGPGLVDRLSERLARDPERRLVVSIPGWRGDAKQPEPGMAPLQILWAGGPARWSAFPRELWMRAGGLDRSLGTLAWRHLWMRLLSLGAVGDRLAFDRIELGGTAPDAGDEPWDELLRRTAVPADLRGRTGRLFLHEARQFLASDDRSRALRPLRAACALLPGREDLRRTLAGMDPGSARMDPDEAMRRAGSLVKDGRHDEAMRILVRAAEDWPRRPEIRHSMAWILLQAGRGPEAELVLSETAKAFPRDRISRECLADLARAAGREDEARTWNDELEKVGATSA